MRLRSTGKEIERLLTLGSIQGPRFYERFLLAVAQPEAADADALLAGLVESDDPLHVTRLTEHALLARVAEFRRYVYYEIARESLDLMTDRPVLAARYAQALRESRQAGLWDSLEPHEQADLAEDLVVAIDEGGLSRTEEWREVQRDARVLLAGLLAELATLSVRES